MAITRVNSASINANSTAATAYTVALGVAVSTGDVIVIAAGSQGTHATNGMSAKMTLTSEAFTTILETQGGNASSRWLQTFKYKATQAFASTDTITFTPYAASTQNAFSVDIFRGADTAVDQAAVGQSNASGTNTAPALGANATSGALVLTFIQTATGTLTAGTPFSAGSSNATNEATGNGYVLSASGSSTYASTWAVGTAGTNSTQTVSLQAAAVTATFVGLPQRVVRRPPAVVRRRAGYQMAPWVPASVAAPVPRQARVRAPAPRTPIWLRRRGTTMPVAPVAAAVPRQIRIRPPAIRIPVWLRRRGTIVPVTAAGAAPCTPPVFGSIGTLFGSSTSTPAFAVPANVAADDIIVVAFFTDVSTTTVTAMPSGFAHAENSPRTVNAGGASSHVLNVCWKRATGNDTGTYGFTLSGAVFVYGNAVRYPGCVTTGSPWDSPTSVADGGNTSSTNTPAVSASTAGDNRRWVFAGTNWNGDGGTWTAPSGFTQRQGGVNTTDIEISDKTQVTQGSSGTVQASNTSSNKCGAWLGALIGTCPTAAAAALLPGVRRRAFPARIIARTRSGLPPAPVAALFPPLVRVRAPALRVPVWLRRRGALPQPVVPVAAPWPLATRMRAAVARLPVLNRRRGTGVPVAAVTVTVPDFVPAVVRRMVRAVRRSPRQVLAVPIEQPTPLIPAATRRTRPVMRAPHRATTPVPDAVAAPWPIPAIRRIIRLPATVRRSRPTTVTPAPVAAPWPIPLLRRMVRLAPPRRSRPTTVAPAAVTVTPPAWVVAPTRHIVRLAQPRRSRPTTVAPAPMAAPWPIPVVRHLVRLAVARRSRPTTLIPTAAAGTAPGWVPAVLRRIIRPPVTRRARITKPVPAPVAAPWPVLAIRRFIRLPWTRRAARRLAWVFGGVALPGPSPVLVGVDNTATVTGNVDGSATAGELDNMAMGGGLLDGTATVGGLDAGTAQVGGLLG